MTSLKVLQALKDKEISLEEAKSKLMQINNKQELDSIKSGENSVLVQGTLLLAPEWFLEPLKEDISVIPEYSQKIAFICEAAHISIHELEKKLPDFRLVELKPANDKESIDERFQNYLIRIMEVIQDAINHKHENPVLLQIILFNQDDKNLFSALMGLLKTAHMENPAIIGQMIEIDVSEPVQKVSDHLEQNAKISLTMHVKYNGEKRYIEKLSEIFVNQQEPKAPWKKGGIYLITGGAGGLGKIFANDIIENGEDNIILLTGRSDISAELNLWIKERKDKAHTIEYYQLDITKKDDVKIFIKNIIKEYGRIDGIIHSAGVIRDNFIIKKNGQDVESVLAPKVKGLLNLDHAISEYTGKIKLDFFVLFSSIAGVMGNLGQIDYAVANAFLDIYAGLRNGDVAKGRKSGRTVAINWPLWKDGGMRIDELSEKQMVEQTGMVPLNTREGIKVFYQAVKGGFSQVMPVEGNVKQMKRYLLDDKTPVKQPVSIDIPKEKEMGMIDQKQLLQKTENYLKNVIATIVKLPVTKIEGNVHFEKFGIDSIIVMQLTSELEKKFGSLSKTLFFEYQNLSSLANYFVKQYSAKLIDFLGIKEEQSLAVKTEEKNEKPENSDEREFFLQSMQDNWTSNLEPIHAQTNNKVHDIAIVGMFGNYPGANDLDEYWNNLLSGKDSITEIPEDRWNWKDTFSEDKNQSGIIYSKWGGFIEGVDEFDPLFFNISPREAETMDPQERLFLECAYKTIEDAGYTRESLSKIKDGFESNNVGVYVGVMYEEYQLYGAQEQEKGSMVALGGVSASVANRVSFVFNLQGPSIAVNTMCSSSLTSVHLACRSIETGECSVAIAGGVNVSVHLNKYLFLSEGKFASSNGRCESFGKGGDGYVPGEGVGAVLLKSLEQAIEDGDHIYGVVKGSMLNTGGKTNGFTVPSPVAQGEVIRGALEKAGVNARDISYIEAHGTGTVLGDPIEISGLTRAFRKYTEDRGYCAIGSVKSNIGHCESAAGIAALTKVLLQMKHRKLVPSLHAEELNPNIDFDSTPFVVQRELSEWKGAYPRRAGVSSFGAGGSNAHLIIEEYVDNNSDIDSVKKLDNPVMIVLSAKDNDRLKDKVQLLLKDLNNNKYLDNQLLNIAYTLQCGREEMEERLGFTAGSIDELKEKLMAFNENNQSIEWFTGSVNENSDAIQILNSDDEMKDTIEKWIQQSKYGKFLELWVKGLSFEWKRLYSGKKLLKISLPTYPFAKEKYWFKESKTGQTAGYTTSFVIHPLLQENTSSLMEQRFSSMFRGEEPFLRDHKIHGRKILPASAYLEMIRAAVVNAMEYEGQEVGVQINQLRFIKAIEVTEAGEKVNIALEAGDRGEIYFEIASETEGTEINSQGTAEIKENKEVKRIDLKKYEEKEWEKKISKEECYEAYKARGIEYGRSHKCIEELKVSGSEVMARLESSSGEEWDSKKYVINPGMMDSALQAMIGYDIKGERTEVPYEIGKIEINGKCEKKMWAILKRKEEKGEKSYEIDLVSQSGEVRVRIQGLKVKEMKNVRKQGTIVLVPEWEKKEERKEGINGKDKERYVYIAGGEKGLAEKLGKKNREVRYEEIGKEEKETGKKYIESSKELIEKIGEIIRNKPEKEVVVQVVLIGEERLMGGVSGILKTAEKEYPRMKGQVIEIEKKVYAEEGLEGINRKTEENLSMISDKHVRYNKGEREVRVLKEIEENGRVEEPWKAGGVYLVSGGLGGIGKIIAEEIARTGQAKAVVLTGRKEISIENENWRKEQEKGGVEVAYRRVDITRKGEVKELIQWIKGKYGKIDGIIHSAGIKKDNYIIKKSQEEAEEVMGAKVEGVINLDEESREERLDYFIMFSSISGLIGNAGQSDYAAGNAFMDEYAEYREKKGGSGKSLTIDWPLWKDGGMRLDEESERIIEEQSGMRAMEKETGINFLYRMMKEENNCAGIVEGEVGRLRESMLGRQTERREEPVPVKKKEKSREGYNLNQLIQKEMLPIVSNILKVSEREIDINAEWNDYGFDPVKMVQLQKDLENKYSVTLEPGVFIDKTNLLELAEYLVKEYPGQFERYQEKQTVNLEIQNNEIERGNTSEEVIKEKTEQYIKRLLSGALKLPVQKIENGVALEKYGIDSVMVMRMTNDLEKVFGTLSKTLFYEYQNIESLSGYFVKQYRAKLEEELGIGKKEEKTEERKETVNIEKEKRANRRERFIRGRVEPRRELKAKEIAIIGISGRYPGARDVEEFWNNLNAGKDSIIEIPESRWKWEEYYEEERNKEGKANSKWGGFIEGVDEFDPLFFNISPREAETMDPQERLFLECAYKTIEDAGYTKESLMKEKGEGNKVGVYAGVMYEEYQLYGAQEQARGRMVSIGGVSSSVANRVSYILNLQGPSMAVNTMCSSSLTAIHLACQSMELGECEVAIAGGVNVSIHPNKYLLLSQGSFVSSKGRCESFGKGGDGYVPGEGVGAVLLKPLEQAIEDGDHIYGVVKGSMLNTGGKTNGYTVPNPVAQGEVIQEALEKAGVNARDISYIEAHGTGTSLGDPIEIAGLTRAFRKYTEDRGYCAIGSVKSNIGHCESAAGIAALTKVLLQMKYRKLVPSLHAEELNPNIDFDSTPFVVQRELSEWKGAYPRRAGVSSFGAGGSNAHLVIEEYVREESGTAMTWSKPAGEATAIILSARDEERLKEKAVELSRILEKGEIKEEDLTGLAYTLQVGREAMEERLGFIAGSIQEVKERLSEYISGKEGTVEIYRGQVKKNQEAMSLFKGDEDLQKAVEGWVTKGKLEKLLEIWVKGLSFEWKRLYGGKKLLKISLPTYPFAREKYWFKSKMQEAENEFQAISPTQTKENVMMQKKWIQKDLFVSDAKPVGSVIVFGVKSLTGMISQLFKGSDGIQVIPVIHDEASKADFYSSADGDDLYYKIKDRVKNEQILGLIDLTALDREYEDSLELEKGKIKFIQKLIENHRKSGLKLLQVTYNLNDFQNSDVSMQGARLAGLYRMLGSEYNQIESVTVDTDSGLLFKKSLINQIQNEFLNKNRDNKTEFCYRQNIRYVSQMNINLEGVELVDLRKPRTYNPDDTIIITGGTRGIGAVIAENAVLNGLKKLVLIGREELPNPSEWDIILQKNETSQANDKIRKLKGFIDQGVEVKYFSVNLSDKAELRKMLKEIREQMGAVTGVYHCAGMVSSNPAFVNKNINDIDEVCAPKIKGMTNLLNVMEKEPLAFFTLFSSISGIIPVLSAGQSDYAMANSYMDYFATKLYKGGKKFIKSIQWPAWSEAGMAAGTKGIQSPAYLKTGFVSLNNKAGIDFLTVSENLSYPVCAPAVIVKENFRIEELLKKEIKSYESRMVLSKKQGRVVIKAKPLQVKSERKNNSTAQDWLKAFISRELKISDAQLDVDKPFDEYGVDSIIIAQLVQNLQSELKASLSPSIFLEYKTIAGLTQYFLTQQPDIIRDRFGISADLTETNTSSEEIQADSEYTYIEEEAINHTEEIAVVGIACNFPGAPNLEAFWELLLKGKVAITPVPENRWVSANRKDYGGYIQHIDSFDAQFFNLKDNDAAIMDPQARIILEESLNVIYNAGYDHQSLSGKNIGVYIGGRANIQFDRESILQANNPILGIGQNYLASNISRFFNFFGPSLVVDTACTSGLTAMSLAIDALRDGRIEAALVGAVNILSSSFAHEIFDARNILSKTGEFHIFDKRENGEVLGEGAGTLMIKRLSDAVRDGNKIYCVVKALELNNDGRTLGPGSPNMNAQKEVMKASLRKSGLNKEDIGYIEVSGGGSPLIDSIEIKALSEVYELNNKDLSQCSVGSVKPNIGHLLLTSGLAGFIRCALSLNDKKIPPFLSAMETVDYYNFDVSRVTFNRDADDWKVESGKKRYAALNSFPDGGTNCNVIFEEFTGSENYQQKLYTKPAPVLNKKSYPLKSENRVETDRYTGVSSMDEIKEQFLLNQEPEIESDTAASTQNFWGKVK